MQEMSTDAAETEDVPPQDASSIEMAQPDGLPLDEILRLFNAWETAKARQIAEGRRARRYYHGKQWTQEEVQALRKRRQPVVTSNRIKRKVDFLVGTEQRLRRDPKAYPRNPSDASAAEVATAAIRFVADANNWPDKASDAAHDGLVSGIGGVAVMAELKRGAGEVALKYLPADRIFVDPRSDHADFSDARYMGLHSWLDIEEAKELFPEKAAQLDSLMATVGGSGATLTPFAVDKEKNWADLEQRRVRLVEMYYKHRSTWRLCYFSGPVKLLDMVSPYLDENGGPDTPMVLWAPYIDEEGDHYGVVRDMISPQDEINHRRSKLLHSLNMRQVVATRGLVKDVDAAKQELARPDGWLEIRGLPGERFQFVENARQIAGQAELLAEAKAEIENLGPNPGLIGRGVESQSGRAILAQQNSGLTELSPVFERLRGWKLRVYRKVWERIRQLWTGTRWLRVTEDAGALQFLAVNHVSETGVLQNVIARIDVDIILDEGLDTLTLREEMFTQMAQMAKAGVPIPPDLLIEASSLPNKDRILARLAGKQDPRAAQAEAVIAEQQLRSLDAAIDETVSKAQLNRAEALKKVQEAELVDAETARLEGAG